MAVIIDVVKEESWINELEVILKTMVETSFQTWKNSWY